MVFACPGTCLDYLLPNKSFREVNLDRDLVLSNWKCGRGVKTFFPDFVSLRLAIRCTFCLLRLLVLLARVLCAQ